MKDQKRPVVVMVSDVMHHIPENLRSIFLENLKQMVSTIRNATIIVKDIEPGYFRSWASLYADRLISGDFIDGGR